AFKRLGCIPFYIDGKRVGIISPEVFKELETYPDVFKVVETSPNNHNHVKYMNMVHKAVYLDERFTTPEDKTEAFNKVLLDMREKDKFFSLRGWRNETYGVYFRKKDPPLCHVERSGCALFGFIQYGVHINGYTYRDGKMMMWVGRRSPTKPTYPNMLDNMCAGGLASGLGILECARKECEEEACVDDETLQRLTPAGTISYCYKDKRGILPETEFVYDLEVSPDFVPKSGDGEMSMFYQLTMEEVQQKIIAEEFKPNCALVIVDFMVRHGLLTPDEEPYYSYIIERMHVNIQPPL
ncbi:hypothetical protein DPMN_001836, partial [Dreissena polymorpha]